MVIMAEPGFKAQSVRVRCIAFQERKRVVGPNSDVTCFRWKSKNNDVNMRERYGCPWAFFLVGAFGSVELFNMVSVQERKVTHQLSCSPSPHLDQRSLLTT